MRTRRPLSEVINEYLIMRDEGTVDKNISKVQVTLLAKRCLRDFMRGIGGMPKTVLIDVDPVSKFVPFPSDYLSYTKVGILDVNNQIQTLYRKDDMNVSRTYLTSTPQVPGGTILYDSDGIELLSSLNPADKTNYNAMKSGISTGDVYYNYTYNGVTGHITGRPGGHNNFGYYNVTDYGIELSLDFWKDKLVLEYVPDLTMRDDPMVYEYMEEPLTAYIYWKYVGKLSVSGVEKQMARKDYYNLRRLAVNKAVKVTLSELVDASRVNSVKKTVQF